MTEIYDNNPGRSFGGYDLLDEIMEAHNLDRREAHEGIHAFLDQIIDIDGEENVILSKRPVHPQLLDYNPNDLDVRWWLTISDDAAKTIRESFAAVYSEDA